MKDISQDLFCSSLINQSQFTNQETIKKIPHKLFSSLKDEGLQDLLKKSNLELSKGSNLILITDTETGGLKIPSDILEFAVAVAVQNPQSGKLNIIGSVNHQYAFDPKKQDKKALEINGAGGPGWQNLDPKKGLKDMMTFFKSMSSVGVPICGHNAIKFDLPQILANSKKNDLQRPFNSFGKNAAKVFDTLHITPILQKMGLTHKNSFDHIREIAHKNPESFKLTSDFLKNYKGKAHTAEYDCHLLSAVYNDVVDLSRGFIKKSFTQKRDLESLKAADQMAGGLYSGPIQKNLSLLEKQIQEVSPELTSPIHFSIRNLSYGHALKSKFSGREETTKGFNDFVQGKLVLSFDKSQQSVSLYNSVGEKLQLPENTPAQELINTYQNIRKFEISSFVYKNSELSVLRETIPNPKQIHKALLKKDPHLNLLLGSELFKSNTSNSIKRIGLDRGGHSM